MLKAIPSKHAREPIKGNVLTKNHSADKAKQREQFANSQQKFAQKQYKTRLQQQCKKVEN